jgi:hypothetical protein
MHMHRTTLFIVEKNMGEEHFAHLPLSPLQKRGMYQNNMYLTFISALNLQ